MICPSRKSSSYHFVLSVFSCLRDSAPPPWSAPGIEQPRFATAFVWTGLDLFLGSDQFKHVGGGGEVGFGWAEVGNGRKEDAL